MVQVNRIFDLLPYYAETFRPKDDVLAGKVNGLWVKYNIQQYMERVDNLSYGLLNLGVKRGDRIATISTNRPEWNIVDIGIQQVGAIHLPIYPTVSEADYQYILNHAEVEYIFVSGPEMYRKIENILPQIKSLKAVVSFVPLDDLLTINELELQGQKSGVPSQLKQLKASILPQDVVTLIYTSGTTGQPKGVMLTHNNIVSNFKAFSTIPPFGQEARALSYLPLCHIYERTVNYMFQYLGVSIYYAENLAKIADNMLEIQPHVMSSVPRLLEKIYDKIIARGRKLSGLKKQLFFWSVKVGEKYELDSANGWLYALKLKIADALVFNKWRAAFGGNMQLVVSGGAAIQERLARVYTAAGIPLIEGYGLTETSPVIAANHFGKNGRKFGTVGPVLAGQEVKIAPDGEILCKGPNVMVGYYKDAENTKAVIDEMGWFHTGDLGQLEPDGQLRITGRKKALFKTSNGKYISPEHIENKFKESAFIDAVLVVGEHQKFPAALVVPDFSHLRSWCAVKGLSYSTNAEMVKIPRIQKRFLKEVAHYNKQLGATEQIKRIELMPAEWSIESRELTASLKLRRQYIQEKYKELIAVMFR